MKVLNVGREVDQVGSKNKQPAERDQEAESADQDKAAGQNPDPRHQTARLMIPADSIQCCYSEDERQESANETQRITNKARERNGDQTQAKKHAGQYPKDETQGGLSTGRGGDIFHKVLPGECAGKNKTVLWKGRFYFGCRGERI